MERQEHQQEREQAFLSQNAVRTAMDHPIGALPRTPFPAAREFPSRGNKRYEEKNRGVICFMYYSSISPFGG